MKLSKTAWLILGIGIFIIAFVCLYVVYSRQRDEEQWQRDSLLAAQNNLSQLISQKEDTESQLTQSESQLTQSESQLAQATSLLNATEANFPESVESIEYDEELFKIADDCDLEIVSLTATEPGEKEGEGVNFSSATFAVRVKGEVADILKFVNTIATNMDFTNATVESVNMRIPEPLTREEKAGLTTAEIKEREMPSASITLIIYGYQGE